MNTVIKTKPDPQAPKAQAAAHYASVTEQADELKVQIAQARTNIKHARRQIEAYEDLIRKARQQIEMDEESILQDTEERARLLRKKRVFARARFDLEQIDED